MAVNSLIQPYPMFHDRDGSPLDGGFIFIGEPGFEARTRPKEAFLDAGLSIPAGTSSGAAVRTVAGRIVRNGTPAMLYVDGDFSITVTDRNGVVVYTLLNRIIILDDGPLAPILAPDGSLLAASFSYANEPTTGRIRAGTGLERDIVLGTVISERQNTGTTFVQPVSAAIIRSVTDLNLLTSGEGTVLYSETASGAEAGGTYTGVLSYQGNGVFAVQRAYVPSLGHRYRVYSNSAWGAWAQVTSSGVIGPTATTTGTVHDFSGIPAAATKIEICLSGVSLSGADAFLLQFIVAGSAITFGYRSTEAVTNSTATSSGSATNGIYINPGQAPTLTSGIITMLRVPGTNNWVFTTLVMRDTTTVRYGAGDMALANPVSGIRLTRDGTNTFDAGSVFVRWSI